MARKAPKQFRTMAGGSSPVKSHFTPAAARKAMEAAIEKVGEAELLRVSRPDSPFFKRLMGPFAAASTVVFGSPAKERSGGARPGAARESGAGAAGRRESAAKGRSRRKAA